MQGSPIHVAWQQYTYILTGGGDRHFVFVSLCLVYLPTHTTTFTLFIALFFGDACCKAVGRLATSMCLPLKGRWLTFLGRGGTTAL